MYNRVIKQALSQAGTVFHYHSTGLISMPWAMISPCLRKQCKTILTATVIKRVRNWWDYRGNLIVSFLSLAVSNSSIMLFKVILNTMFQISWYAFESTRRIFLSCVLFPLCIFLKLSVTKWHFSYWMIDGSCWSSSKVDLEFQILQCFNMCKRCIIYCFPRSENTTCLALFYSKKLLSVHYDFFYTSTMSKLTKFYWDPQLF